MVLIKNEVSPFFPFPSLHYWNTANYIYTLFHERCESKRKDPALQEVVKQRGIIFLAYVNHVYDGSQEVEEIVSSSSKQKKGK